MVAKVMRVSAFAALGVLTMGINCGGTKQFWASVSCAVARNGAEEGVTVSFIADKLEQSGRIAYEPHFEWSATTKSTGWTPAHVCGAFPLKFDGRSGEYLEAVRVIATVNDEGTIYTDTQDFFPMPFLDDTQTVSALRIDLPPLK
jgi:hypothetical protein